MWIDVVYDEKNMVRKEFPAACRVFKIGDRVLIHHKTKYYSGFVREIRKRKALPNGFSPDPHIYVKTDERVSDREDDLYNGFGLRGPHTCIRFEDETEEFARQIRGPVIYPITKEELREHQKETRGQS